MANKNFNEMELALQKTSTKLSVRDDEKKYVDAYKEIKDEFIKALQDEDTVFNTCKKIQFTGSSYERTRIRKADEFDLNICIKFPFDYDQVIIENGPIGGYVTIKIPGQLNKLKKLLHWNDYKSLNKFIDEDDFILQKEFREWMHSVSQKTFNKLENSSNSVWKKYKVVMKTAGPSIGLWVTEKSTNIKFSVDCVPVLIFDPLNRPSCVPKEYVTDEWCAVPKPPPSPYDEHEDAKKLWRVSLPQQERDMLIGKNQLKAVLRLIKQLRDVRQFACLKSYFIKTVFMLMDKQNEDVLDFWNKSLSNLFMLMLYDLYEKVCDENIPFFWDHSLNLLSAPTAYQLNHCKESLKGAIKFFNKNFDDESKIINYLMLDKQPNECCEDREENQREGDQNSQIGVGIGVGVGVAVAIGVGALLINLFGGRRRQT